jgi:hypothetical protein
MVRLELLLSQQGPISAPELAAEMGVDATTVTRAIGRMGERVASIGATRRTRYLLRKPILREESKFGIFRIAPDGQAALWGELECFHGGWRFQWVGSPPRWADRFHDADGLWREMPFFLTDVTPQGFLGRGIASKLAQGCDVPSDPSLWADAHRLLYLQGFGDDVPGDLVVGEAALRRAISRRLDSSDELRFPPHMAIQKYPGFVETLVPHPPPGPPLSGEQPKFAVILQDPGEVRPMIVKFSPPVAQPAGRRWADLLTMESHAHKLLARAGLGRDGTRIIDAGGRRFLEIPRFDRSPEGGRMPSVSLFSLHRAATGRTEGDWVSRALDLEKAGLIDAATLVRIRKLHAFAELVGSSDRGAGNLSFHWDDEGFQLAPAYDILPMHWAPGPQGELAERRFSPELPAPASREAWLEMLPLAREFWSAVIADQRISRDFAATARAAGEVLARLAEAAGATS